MVWSSFLHRHSAASMQLLDPAGAPERPEGACRYLCTGMHAFIRGYEPSDGNIIDAISSSPEGWTLPAKCQKPMWI
jgi:hypothetical protein